MSWLANYLEALKQRDLGEQTTLEIYRNYAYLTKKVVTEDCGPPMRVEHGEQAKPVTSRQSGQRTPDAISDWKGSLADAQKKRMELQNALELANRENEKSRAQASADARRLDDLASENSTLTIRLKDRMEELHGKTKLLEDLHDETVALTLQLNVVEERNAKLAKENEELVERWMARVGQEAEAMNRASDFS